MLNCHISSIDFTLSMVRAAYTLISEKMEISSALNSLYAEKIASVIFEYVEQKLLTLP